jgi:hypothetical protein
LFEREGGDAAEDQSGDEEREPDANGTKQFSFAFRLFRVRRGELIDWSVGCQETGSPGLLSKAVCCLEEEPC